MHLGLGPWIDGLVYTSFQLTPHICSKPQRPLLSRTWAAHQRGYRREGDAVWVASKTAETIQGEGEGDRGGLSLRVHTCGEAGAVVARGVEVRLFVCFGRCCCWLWWFVLLLVRVVCKDSTNKICTYIHPHPQLMRRAAKDNPGDATDLLVLNIPFIDYYTPEEEGKGGDGVRVRHYTSLAQLDGA